MRRLIVLRHSKAERAAPDRGDFERPLSDRGRADAARTGAYLARHDLSPNYALVSPARRAQETWTAAAAQLQRKPGSNDDPRIYNATTDALLSVIATAPAKAELLILVGHNPGLHELAMQLSAAGDVETRERLREGLPTSGLVVISFAFEDWTAIAHARGRLERFVSPGSLGTAAN
ncbi:MAG: histidine phosphatase family protein [Pseudolabrys sp.]|nr:histidine phosphatase family protein [Pseudolabrys sp.]MBV9954344.1 histidine phosphatase family protein [Pseudolabrys sp.]